MPKPNAFPERLRCVCEAILREVPASGRYRVWKVERFSRANDQPIISGLMRLGAIERIKARTYHVLDHLLIARLRNDPPAGTWKEWTACTVGQNADPLSLDHAHQMLARTIERQKKPPEAIALTFAFLRERFPGAS